MKKLISDALTAAAFAGSFIEATYDATTRVLVQGSAVSPASVETNEVSSAYKVESKHGRAYVQDRAQWVWELRLRFNSEVITEPFEDSLLQTPLYIPRDEASGVLRSLRLHLLDSSYEHPPRQGASNGTEAIFRFSADFCRK